MDLEACRADIIIETVYARAVRDSIQPDNASPHDWLKVECKASDDRLHCVVTVEGCRDPRRLLTLRNTVDDLLEAVKTALSALDASEPRASL